MSKIKIVNLANYLLPVAALWLGFVLVCFALFINKNIGDKHLATGINQQINYQGRLLTSTGAVVPDGSYNIEFKIYQDGDGVIGGGDETLKWTETRTSSNKVLVKNGYFSVYLGSITSFGSSIDWNQDTLWLSVNIGGTASPSWDGEMSPFTRFSSTPYALNSKALNGLESSNFVQLAQGTQTDLSTTNASISINKTGATASILDLMRSGVSVLSIANNGATLFKNTTDSSTAFQIKNSNDGQLFGVDTINSLITLNGLNSPKLQTWTSTSTLLTARRTPSVAYGNNGYIYTVGGYAGGYSATSEYAKVKSDGTLGGWTAGTSLNTARQGAATVVANGYLYVIGGTNGSSLSDVEYARINNDGTLGSWVVSTSSLNTARERTSAVAVNGYIYVVAGSGGSSLSSVEYAKVNADGTLGTWSTTNSLNTARNSHAVVAANGYVYAIAGMGGSNLSSVEYAKVNADGTLGTWSTTNSLNTARNSLTSSVANGYIYAIGGNTGSITGSIEYAALSTNGTLSSWTTDTNSLGVPRDDLKSVVANGYIYAIAGYSGSFSNVVEYSSAARTKVGGTLDLVGLGVGDLVDGESGGGGGLTAGDTKIIGGLQVQGQANFARGLNTGSDITVGGSEISGASALTVRSGGVNALSLYGEGGIYMDSSSLGQIFIGTSGTLQDVTLGNQGTSSATRLWAGTSGVTVQPGANTNTAFQIKNSSNTTVFGIDTNNSRIFSDIVDGGSAVGFKLNTTNSYATAGAKLLNVSNNGTEKFSIDKDGNLTVASGAIFKIDSTSGLTASCSSGQFLRGQVALGGLTTSGTCAEVTGTEITDGTIANGDLANSSINLALGTSGSDINWGASSVSLGGTATLNLPDASASARGLVTAGAQTFGGDKVFQGSVDIRGSAIDLGNNPADIVTMQANVKASNIAQGVTGTTTGTGSNTTTLTLTSDAFNVGDVVMIDNAGQDYFTRITVDPGTGSYTVSPAVTFETGRTVEKYNIQNIGATQSDYSTLTNRFFQGYFLGGIVTGTGTTSLSDGLLYSSGPLNINASSINFNSDLDLANNLLLNIGNSGTDFTSGGGLTLAGTLTANGGLSVLPSSAGTVAATITARASQTADLLRIVNESGINLVTVNPNVGFTIRSSSGFTSTNAFSVVRYNGSDTIIIGVNSTTPGLYTDSTSFDLINTNATTLNFGGAATTLNIGPGNGTATSVNIAGGYAATGCTVSGASGDLSCSGALTTDSNLNFSSATPNINLTATDNTGEFSIEDASGNALFTVKDLSTNFGAYAEAGAFMSRNSFFQEEFQGDKTDITSARAAGITTNGASSWGDAFYWSTFEVTLTGDCTYSVVDDAINGIGRIQNDDANTGCTAFTGSPASTTAPHAIFDANNLPVMLMKVRPSNVGANDDLWVGMGYQSGNTIANNLTPPAEGIYFSNNDGTTWTGTTRNASTSTNVACTGQTVSTTQYALLKIEVVSTSSVRFYVDADVSDGIQWVSCGTSTTNIPTATLAGFMKYASTTGARSLDIDFFRIWQDDNIQSDDGLSATKTASQEESPLEIIAEGGMSLDGVDSKSILADMAACESDKCGQVDIDAGRLYAGAEVITQKITTDDVSLNSINSTDGSPIKLNGDLNVSGTLTADKIRANQIEGLEIMTSNIIASSSPPPDDSGDGSTNNILDLRSVNFGSVSVNLNLDVNGAIIANGGLTVSGLATFNGDSVFNGLSRFINSVVFSKDVQFQGNASFNNDTGGFVVIEPGQTEVRVKFSKAYVNNPVVNLNIKNGQFVNYAYKDLDKEGFTIILKEPYEFSTEFSWTAFDIKDIRTITKSLEGVLVNEP